MDQKPKEFKRRIRRTRAVKAAAQQKHAAKCKLRKNILNAAARLFCEKGFSDTTMDQIAALVELTKPSLYFHFRGVGKFEVKGKQKILLTCLDEAIIGYTAAIDKIEKDTSPPGEHRVRFVVEQYADMAFQELGMWLLCVGTHLLSVEQRKTYCRKKADNRFKSALVKLMPVGVRSPEFLSEMFLNLVQGLAMLQDSKENKRKILSAALDLAITGLSVAKSEH